VNHLVVLADFKEEHWPSMDLMAEMLHHEIEKLDQNRWQSELVIPTYRPRFEWAKWLVGGKRAKNIDRLYNRFRVYRQHLSRLPVDSIFHICDHSYAHLANDLPKGRVGVFCHDLDTYRCLLEPAKCPRPGWFRKMTKSILSGLKNAEVVFHPTMEIRREILQHNLVAEERLVFAPNGVSDEFHANGRANDEELLSASEPMLLNVGSCIPRKRIDVLLELFATIRRSWPNAKLLQIGGTWTDEQEQQIDSLDIRPSLRQIRGISREELASFYRQAAMVLQPTEAEGFGLPILEAIACGAIVVASDIRVLREIGGDATVFAPVANIEAWFDQIMRIRSGSYPTLAVRQNQASKYRWSTQANIILESYDHVLAK